MNRRRYLRERVADGLAFAVVTVFVSVPLAVIDVVEHAADMIRNFARR